MPASHRGTPTKPSVIEESNGDEADAWTTWRSQTAALVHDVFASAGLFEDEAVQLTRADAFDIVKSARATLHAEDEARRARKDTPASPGSLADYAKKCRQIDAELDDLEPGSPKPLFLVMSRHAARKQTFAALKTALKWRGLERVKTLLKAQDALQRSQPESMSWRQSVLRLKRAAQELDMVQSLHRETCLEWSGKKAKASLSKKRDLPRLPDGWQDRFLKINESSPTYRMAGVLLRHCGLRPIELSKGVHITSSAQGVCVHIEGGKVRETAGQPWREFTLQSSLLPEWFVQAVQGPVATVVKVAEGGLRSHLGRLSERVFNLADKKNSSRRKQPILSAYTFRHALVTELREGGWETDDIAAVIGESSASTVRHYGTRVRTHSRKPKPISIVAGSVQVPRAVRPVDMSGLERVQNKLSKDRSGPRAARR